MTFVLDSRSVSLARLSFGHLENLSPEIGDRFFEAFGPGNALEIIDRPYERFWDYEFLLNVLRQDNPRKYQEIHKGTAFYFLAWTSFLLRNYEKAVFYMDAAISEDIRKTVNQFKKEHPNDTTGVGELSKKLLPVWIKNPSGQFFSMDDRGNQVAKNITMQLREIFQSELNRFGDIVQIQLAIDNFIEKFILKLAESYKTRSIITALY